MSATVVAYQFFFGSHIKSRLVVVTAVGATVTCETREHEAKAAKELCACAECASQARNAGPLAQRDCCRHMTDIIDQGFGRL